MTLDIPRNVMLPVDEVDVRFDPAPHPFERDHAEEIAANWEDERAANPALFNGIVLLHSHLALHGRRVVGTCHAVNFAALLYWRKQRGVPSAQHAFAAAALISRDNALIPIRMGPHTASAGRVVFAGGSFDMSDLADGRVDVDANMAREVKEETGIDLAGLRRDARFLLYSTEQKTAIMRRYWLDVDADETVRRIEAFVAGETEPEISGPVVIRAGDPMPAQTIAYLAAFADWHFSLTDWVSRG